MPLPIESAESLGLAAALEGTGGLGAQWVSALLDNYNASSVINAMFERRYRIVHVCANV